jgi:hypothetical protein
MAKRRISEADGQAALTAALAGDTSRTVLATAGNSVEVRVPPFGATQCVAGPKHTRGTPPNVIETDPETWLALATGRIDWQTAVEEARIVASGSRADLHGLLPIMRRPL